jgi:hypothetical protein
MAYFCLPSRTASARREKTIWMTRMASSLPGIGMSTELGSPSVSMSAMTLMPDLRASATAFFSRRGSAMISAAGSFYMFRSPSRLRFSFRFSRITIDFSFFVYRSSVPAASCASISSRRFNRELIVV